MVSSYQVFEALRAGLVTAVSGLKSGGNNIVVTSGIGWPGEDSFQDLARNTYGCLLTVFDRGISRQVKGWLPFLADTFQVATGITVALSKPNMGVGGTVTVTLGGTPTLNDAVGIGAAIGQVPTPVGVLGQVGITPPLGAVAISVVSETLTTLAAKLATAINATATLNTWVSAAAVGAVVTITNISAYGIKLTAAVGNIATTITEVGRQCRQAQIVIWANTQDVRKQVATALESWLLSNKSNFGFVVDNTDPANPQSCRMDLIGSQMDESNIQKDLYGHNFVVDLEYGVMATDTVYSVLVGIGTYSQEF